MNRKYYFDYAATTPTDSRVIKAMTPYFSDKFGNNSSFHFYGRQANEAVEKSRRTLAKIINAKTKGIFFTSSATESNNLALRGVAYANRGRGNHIIVSSVEHDCVLNTAKALRDEGFKVDFAPVNKYGEVDLKKLSKMITPETIIVSAIHANNEIGTIQNIKAIGKLCHEKGALFHTDASQSFAKIDIDVEADNIDLLTASSHKIYGPKGAALLYVKKGVQIKPILFGGGQEHGLRSSTLNVPAIVGFAKAAQITFDERKGENQWMQRMRNRLIKEILKVPNSYLNGHPVRRLPNNINVRFDFIEGESLLMLLDMEGIAVSTASACSSPKLQPSHVLLACGLKHGQAHGSLRISLGRYTKELEVSYLLKKLPQIVHKLRKISPLANS